MYSRPCVSQTVKRPAIKLFRSGGVCASFYSEQYITPRTVAPPMQRLLQLQRGKRRNRDVRREEARASERAKEKEGGGGGRERTDRRTNIKSFVSPTTSDILCVFFVDRKDDPNKGHSFCISLKLIRYIASRSFIAFFTIAAIFEGRIRNLTPYDLFLFLLLSLVLLSLIYT